MDQEVQELQTEIQNSILDEYSDGWVRFVVQMNSTQGASEFLVTSFSSEGEERSVKVPSRTVRALISLREAMATPNHGVWFSCKTVLDRDLNSLEIAYNYDDRPEWAVEPYDETYIDDLEHFPRPYAEIPEWHPVRSEFTEQQWLAKFPQFAQ
ncbi:hypothetical protein EH165_12385 [Nakamurella antarctica]|uniref:DUF600 family protein n=1 Tax=Nakamurella antarctica TaxID=1902245 RepID=A0A3G8ZPT7_9ACTN|nr:hypothetical protein [Nakamurella antarctica]AZI58815.1 hypothetical protein EH165_12385 [Nakamurella antarctica]